MLFNSTGDNNVLNMYIEYIYIYTYIYVYIYIFGFIQQNNSRWFNLVNEWG